MLPVHLQRSAVAAIVDCPVRGQFTGSRSLKPVAPQSIWLFQESLINLSGFIEDWYSICRCSIPDILSAFWSSTNFSWLMGVTSCDCVKTTCFPERAWSLSCNCLWFVDVAIASRNSESFSDDRLISRSAFDVNPWYILQVLKTCSGIKRRKPIAAAGAHRPPLNEISALSDTFRIFIDF